VENQNRLHRLVGRMAMDAEFRYSMLQSPVETAKSAGVFLTSEQARTIQQLDAETVNALADKFKNIVPTAMSW
jgi:hypothetical protein